MDKTPSEFTAVEEAYGCWLRAKVRASLADVRPSIPHDQVMAEMDAMIDCAEQNQSRRPDASD